MPPVISPSDMVLHAPYRPRKGNFNSRAARAEGMIWFNRSPPTMACHAFFTDVCLGQAQPAGFAQQRGLGLLVAVLAKGRVLRHQIKAVAQRPLPFARADRAG